MRTYFKTLIVGLIFILTSCSDNKDRNWNTIAVGLPKEVKPSIAQINMGLYVIKQTHEPILRPKNRNELYSQILSKWNRNKNNTAFKFCLKENLVFDDDMPYKQEEFHNHLKVITKKIASDVVIKKSNQCSIVEFKGPQNDFLSYLAKYENAPSKKVTNRPWEIGLGPYKVVSLEDQKIKLIRKKPTDDGYNEIIFESYNGADDKILKRKEIEDFNRVLITDLPSWIKESYKEYNVALLQSVNLLINVKNKDERKYLFNCLDIEKFRQAFMPKQLSFTDIKTILPIGIPSAKKGKAAQNCKKLEKLSPKYKFYNWNKSSSESLKNYFADLKEKTNILIEVVDITMDYFVEIILKNPHPYDLTVAALDAVSIDYDAFYSPVLSDVSVIDFRDDKSQKLYNKFKTANKKGLILEDLNKAILESNLILPLYQEVRDFYYPKQIKNLNLGIDDLEYLEIGDLKI
ncbi:MAG: hypothetical protein N4A33_10805 [Bacteriovoracaceae bacterium]|jgi:MarR-like DNA-binding transcriptional regulator SgrR of sgrS sRNA|nr:hypothetical protein [Bacteriovoracaceae bacterium]